MSAQGPPPPVKVRGANLDPLQARRPTSAIRTRAFSAGLPAANLRAGFAVASDA